MSPLEDVLSKKEVVVVCGPGGVGKTTLAAALGLGAALRMTKKVLVITVDPARRLVDALSIKESGNELSRVHLEAFTDVVAEGELYVAMVDAKASWDALVRRHSRRPEEAREVLANPLYQAFAGRFALSHEYVAMERVFEIYESHEFDLIVVDTPPSKDALDFLDAPRRMREFFSSRLLWWLTVPARSRVAGLAARPFLLLAGRLLGETFLHDVARFFYLLQAMYDGFVQRSRAVGRVLGAETTTFVVATALERLALDEAVRLVEEVRARALDPGVIVANRVLPEAFGDAAALELANALVSRPERTRGRDGALEAVLKAAGENYARLYERAAHERELLLALDGLSTGRAIVPYRTGGESGEETLISIAEDLFSSFEVQPGAAQGPKPARA